ncbi:MAG: DUF2232 domain-containing protein [Solibacillus sp.]
MPNNKTKGLVQGAMMVAIFTILLAITVNVPLISIVASLFAPLPIAWYSATYARKMSILVTVVAVLLSFFIGGILVAPIALVLAAAGFVIGDGLRLKKSKIYLFISTSVVLLFTFAIEYLISLRLFEFDLIQDSLKMMKESYVASLEFVESTTGQSPLDEEALADMFNMVEMTIPASVTMAMVFLSIIFITVNFPLLKRFGIEVPKFATFKNLRLPRAVLWYYLIVLSINLFVHPEMGTTLHMIMLNISMLLWVLLTIQGLAFIFYVLDAYQSPSILKVVTVFMAIPLYSFVILIGILDLGFNMREYINNKTQK